MDKRGIKEQVLSDMSGRLTPEELLRYSRHLLIPSIGEAGQLRLKNAAVLLIGTAVHSWRVKGDARWVK